MKTKLTKNQSGFQEIRKVLQEYADRGIFRGFHEKRTAGKSEFQFLWFGDKTMVLVYEDKNHLFVLKNWLPEVPSSSRMYSELKAFVRERFSLDLPEHRRIERNFADFKCSNKGGIVSFIFKVKKNQFQYGAKKLVNMIHEIYFYLKVSHVEYVWANFGELQE